MIDRNHALPVVRQCLILRLARSTAYYTPEPASPADLALMRRIDKLHLDYPFAGSRVLRDMLRREGRHGKPDIFSTDQGSQFTSVEFTTVLKENGIRISMDGRGCWRDSVFVERLWHTLKCEEVYLKAYDSVSAAKASLGIYIDFYNTRGPHGRLTAKRSMRFTSSACRSSNSRHEHRVIHRVVILRPRPTCGRHRG